MSKIKFVSLFPELNKNNINEITHNKIQRKKNFTNYKDNKSIPISVLLFRDDFNYSNKRLESEFLKNKVKFFSPYTTSNTQMKIQNKTDFKYPIINNKKKTCNKLTKNINKKNIPLYKESKPMIYKIFDKFDEINEKYKKQNKYYNHYIKNEDNNRKITINKNKNRLNNLTSFLLTKNNSKKYCSYVYRRIKSIE